jgi:hypothetical protein
MGRKRHTAEQIIGKLRTAEIGLDCPGSDDVGLGELACSRYQEQTTSTPV